VYLEIMNKIIIQSRFLSFVACPAISMPQLDNNDTFNKTDKEIFKNKIKLIFQIAHQNNHDSLVLGTFGCGAFGCPIKHVAKLLPERRVAILFYEEIMACNFPFKLIIFAILGRNYDLFNGIFNDLSQ